MKTGRCASIKPLVCLIVVLFGMGSWIGINGIWVELPILVERLPEGWSLPSYISIVVQIANIGPIIYVISTIIQPNVSYEKTVGFLMVVTGSAALLLLAVFWKHTSVIGGVDHSTALLSLLLVLALVDCSSSVVFLPFMNTFKHDYITFYYIGEGLSGLVPSLLSLAQGTETVKCQNISIVNASAELTKYFLEATYLPPKYSVKIFFLLICSVMVFCGVALTLLIYLPYCKTEHVNENFQQGFSKKFSSPVSQDSINPQEHTEDSNVTAVTDTEMYSLPYNIYLLLSIGWINALLNGVLPSVQSYACMPYGSAAYHLSVTLSNMASPVACFIAFILPVKSSKVIAVMTFTGSVLSLYILSIALGSPAPLLMDSGAGGALVIIAYVLVYWTFTFTKVTIASLFRLKGRRSLLCCGAAIQLGSAIGAAVMFVVINVYNSFQQKYPCN